MYKNQLLHCILIIKEKDTLEGLKNYINQAATAVNSIYLKSIQVIQVSKQIAI